MILFPDLTMKDVLSDLYDENKSYSECSAACYMAGCDFLKYSFNRVRKQWFMNDFFSFG